MSSSSSSSSISESQVFFSYVLPPCVAFECCPLLCCDSFRNHTSLINRTEISPCSRHCTHAKSFSWLSRTRPHCIVMCLGWFLSPSRGLFPKHCQHTEQPHGNHRDVSWDHLWFNVTCQPGVRFHLFFKCWLKQGWANYGPGAICLSSSIWPPELGEMIIHK